MKKIYLVATIFLQLIVLPSAFGAIKFPGIAAQTVRAYCTIEASGALSSAMWKYSQQVYTTWEDAPGYDGAIVINDFEIISEEYNQGDKATVIVKYDVAGVTEGTATGEVFKGAPKVETVKFILKKFGSEWKIETPQIGPHIFKSMCSICQSK